MQWNPSQRAQRCFLLVEGTTVGRNTSIFTAKTLSHAESLIYTVHMIF